MIEQKPFLVRARELYFELSGEVADLQDVEADEFELFKTAVIVTALEDVGIEISHVSNAL